jgi:hypothetical protein
MTLYLFLLVSILVYISLRHFFIPMLEGKGASGQKTFKKSAALAVLKYLSTASLLAAATYTLFVVLVFILSLTRPVTSAQFGAAIANIQWLQSKYKIFRDYWTLWLFLMLVLAYVAYRRSKKSAAREAGSVRPKAAEAVNEPPLPPNEEMEEIMLKISECELRAKRLEQSWVRSDEELMLRMRELSRESEGLRAELRKADVRRRTRPATLNAHEAVPARESYWRLRRFFSSKGLLKTLESTTRSLGYVGTILLVLCVVGVNTPLLHRALENRAVHLNELQVEASKDEALQSFNKVMAEEGASVPRPLSEEDRRVINETARLFEQAFASSKELRQERNKDDDDKTHAVFYMRCRLARDQIVADFKRNPPGGPNPPDAGPSSGPEEPNGSGPSGPDEPPGPSGRRRTGGVEPPRGGSGGGGVGNSTGSGGSGGGSEAGGAGGRTQQRPVPPAPPAGGASDDLRTRLISDDHGPRTKLGRDFAAALEKEVAVRPRLLEKLKGKLNAFKSSFNEPFELPDLGKFAFGEAVGYALDKSWQTSDEVTGQVKKVGQTAFKDAAKNLFARAVRGGKTSLGASVVRMYQTLKCRFVSDVAGDASFGDAVEHVQEGLPEQPVLTDEEIVALREVAAKLPREEPLVAELTDSYKSRPPALPYNEAERAENEAEAARLRKMLRGRSDRVFSEEELKLVDSYEDHYPGHLGSEADTPKGRLLEAAGRKPAVGEAQQRLAQSRDFSGLKQSVDVGGILMGRSPTLSNGGGDFVDLRWNSDDGGVTIFVRREDGSEVAIGPFEKSLVHQALGYVADDRKVVVTIISGGKGSRKVMLHPALVDTRLGWDIIEFDKLVFRFMNRCDSARKPADNLITAQLSLYNLASELRALSVLRQWASDGSLTAAGRKELSVRSAWESRIFSSAKAYEMLSPGLLDADELDRPEKSILAWGKAYFDQTLVRDIKRCASQSREHLPTFHECLSETFSANASYATDDTLQDWLKPPPDLAPRSIAEEQPYQVDASLSFLKHVGTASPAEQLWPFQFRYEIAFPSNAPYRNISDTSDAYRTPWEFATLRGPIADKVWGGVKADADLRSLYQRVRDFTVLQRLFRTSLEGGLGHRFPVEKLVLLTRATAGSLVTVKTPRKDDLPARKCD